MTEIEEKVRAAFRAIVEDKTKFYLQQPILCDLDYKVKNLIELFRDASPPQRDLFFSHNNADFSWMLVAFAQRMASLAVRERSGDRVIDGLLALIIEDQRIDWRDSLPRIAVLYDAAGKVSASPDELLLTASAFADNRGAAAVAEFTKRSPLNKSLKVFPTYKEESNGPDGFRYMQSLRG